MVTCYCFRNADSEKEVKSTKWGENQLQFIMELSELLVRHEKL